jgi:hypothetical protein
VRYNCCEQLQRLILVLFQPMQLVSQLGAEFVFEVAEVGRVGVVRESEFGNIFVLLSMLKENSLRESSGEALPASLVVSEEVLYEGWELGFRWSTDEAQAVGQELQLEGSEGARGEEGVDARGVNSSVGPVWCV